MLYDSIGQGEVKEVRFATNDSRADEGKYGESWR